MAISDLLNRRVRARPDDEEEVYSDVPSSDRSSDEEQLDNSNFEDLQGGSSNESEGFSSDDSDNQGAKEIDDDGEGDFEDDSENSEDDVQASLSNISFGALAKAQASLGSKLKRHSKTLDSTKENGSEPSPLDDIRAKIREAREQKRIASLKSKASEKASRSSKHAPAVQSSKFAVSRKLTIAEPLSVAKSRDPRFDPTVVGRRGRNNAAPSDAYSFLDDYRIAELKEMKEQLAKTKDPRQKEILQRSIRSANDRLRTIENNKREKEVLAEHKKREKQLIREGKKSNPYFLKKSELKKQVLMKKYESMNSKDRAKALERRRKKVASKEIKEMPMERRGLEGDVPGSDGSRKRRRVA